MYIYLPTYKIPNPHPLIRDDLIREGAAPSNYTAISSAGEQMIYTTLCSPAKKRGDTHGMTDTAILSPDEQIYTRSYSYSPVWKASNAYWTALAISCIQIAGRRHCNL